MKKKRKTNLIYFTRPHKVLVKKYDILIPFLCSIINTFLKKSFKGKDPLVIEEEDSYEEFQWQLDDNFVYKLVNSNLGNYEYTLEIEGDVYRKVNNIINPQKAKN